MPILNVLIFPDKRLKKVAEEVKEINDNTREIVQNMFETMYAENGAGLAATQVDIHERIIVMDVSDDDSNNKYCFINPEIINFSGNIVWHEACLSFPGVSAKVNRHNQVTVKYLNEFGEEKILEASPGLMSVCIQHEIDHLNGITFFDHLSPLKQKMLRSKFFKNKKVN